MSLFFCFCLSLPLSPKGVHVVIWYILGLSGRYMGTLLGPQYIPYTYMDPLGLSRSVSVSLSVSLALRHSVSLTSSLPLSALMRRDCLQLRLPSRRGPQRLQEPRQHCLRCRLRCCLRWSLRRVRCCLWRRVRRLCCLRRRVRRLRCLRWHWPPSAWPEQPQPLSDLGLQFQTNICPRKARYHLVIVLHG